MPKTAEKESQVKVLDRNTILSAQDLTTELVEVPEWGGSVYVRGLSGAERDAYESSIMSWKRGKRGRIETEPNLENAKAKLVARCIVDANGKRLFSDADIVLLGKKSAAALNRLYEAAQRLSGITNEDIEELTENLEGNPTEG